MSEKLFVAGVSWSTTDGGFKECFAKFGEVTEAQVMREPSGRSRGFGFVVFADDAVKNKVLGQQVKLDGRQLDIKQAVSKEEIKQQTGDALDTRKIWVAGLSYDTTDDALFNYFAQLGEVEKASTMRDKATGKSRGFGFVTYTTQETTDEVLKRTDLELDKRKLELKLAVPKGGSVTALPKKVYVAGLLETTSQEAVEGHFSQFGALTDCAIQKGKNGLSRGFAFVTYENPTDAAKVIAFTEHVIDDKKVDCKACVPKSAPPVAQRQQSAFGGGMPPNSAANIQAKAAMMQMQARQYQMQLAAMQHQMQAAAQAQQVQAAFAAASRVQPQAQQAYAGQYPPSGQGQFAGMQAGINAAMTATQMQSGMNPNQQQGTGSQGYPAQTGYAAAQAGYAATGQTQQSYDAYTQDQRRGMGENQGAYSVANNVYAQQASRTPAAAADPYSQSYAGYSAEDAYAAQYGHAASRRVASRTVGYHPYNRA